VLTMHDDTAYLRSALAAGASGYVVKKSADSELISAITAVHRGQMFVDLASSSGAIQEALLYLPSKEGSRSGDPRSLLSQREKAVLTLLAEGYTNQQVADRLCLSVKTIETYRMRLAEKLGLRSRADLTRYALEIGLIGPGKFPHEASSA
jgi:two-component system response regulator NreC